MSDNCELRWQPTKDQLDNMILPAYTDMAKQSVAYVNQFGCPPEYVADMLRDIADALITIHPESESEGGCSCWSIHNNWSNCTRNHLIFLTNVLFEPASSDTGWLFC